MASRAAPRVWGGGRLTLHLAGDLLPRLGWPRRRRGDGFPRGGGRRADPPPRGAAAARGARRRPRRRRGAAVPRRRGGALAAVRPLRRLRAHRPHAAAPLAARPALRPVARRVLHLEHPRAGGGRPARRGAPRRPRPRVRRAARGGALGDRHASRRRGGGGRAGGDRRGRGGGGVREHQREHAGGDGPARAHRAGRAGGGGASVGGGAAPQRAPSPAGVGSLAPLLHRLLLILYRPLMHYHPPTLHHGRAAATKVPRRCRFGWRRSPCTCCLTSASTASHPPVLPHTSASTASHPPVERLG